MSDSESVRQVRELAAAVREAHRQSFLRGVRAGLKAAGEAADKRAGDAMEAASAHFASRNYEGERWNQHERSICSSLANAIRSIDPEKVTDAEV